MKNVLLHVTFLFGLLPNYAFSTFLPDWSLSLEMQSYAVFPAIFLAMRRWGVWQVALLIGALSIPLTAYLDTLTGMTGAVGLFAEPSFLPLKIHMFLVGMIAAQVRAPALPIVIGRICSTKLVRFMADASYSVYLVHGFFIALIAYFGFRPYGLGLLPGYERALILWVLVAAGSYGFAPVVRQVIELSGINAGKWVIALVPDMAVDQLQPARRLSSRRGV